MPKSHILSGLNSLLVQDFPPRIYIWPSRHTINFFKGATLPFCLLLIYLSDYSKTVAQSNSIFDFCPSLLRSIVYTVLHGSYGLLWLMKDYTFPDPAWSYPQTIGSFIITLIVLGPGYWSMPYVTILNISEPVTCKFLELVIMKSEYGFLY